MGGCPTPQAAGFARVYYTQKKGTQVPAGHTPQPQSPIQHWQKPNSPGQSVASNGTEWAQPAAAPRFDSGSRPLAEHPATVFAIITMYPSPGAEGQECDDRGYCVVLLSGCLPVGGFKGSPRRRALDERGETDQERTTVTLLGYQLYPQEVVALKWTASKGGGIKVWVPPLGAFGSANVTSWAYVLRLEGVR